MASGSEIAKNSSVNGVDLPSNAVANQAMSPQVNSGLHQSPLSRTLSIAGNFGRSAGGLQRTSSCAIVRDRTRQTVRKRVDPFAEEFKNRQSAAATNTNVQDHSN